MGKQVLRVSDAVALALHTMAYFAAHPEDNIRVKDVAALMPVSEHHLAKVFQRLHRAGLLLGRRGRTGGYRLHRPAEDITLLDIFQAIEGKIGGNECLLDIPICRGQKCILGTLLRDVERLVLDQLGSQTLKDIDNPFGEIT